MKLALVGAGGIGKTWVSGLAKTQGIQLVSVVDSSVEKAEALAAAVPGARAETDFLTAVSSPDVDAVLVATPHYLLAPVTKAALEAGKHVLCEKPAGISSAEVEANIALARGKGLVYMVGFNYRFHPAYARAKELVAKGEIGEPMFVRARHGFGGRPGYEKEWRFDRKISGGGELIDQGMHMIDLARWFLGDFENVQGLAENMFWGGEVEDNGFLLLRTKDRKVAQIHVSWTNWEWVNSFEIFGKDGYLWIDGLDKRYRGPERLTIGKRDETYAKPTETVETFDTEQKDDSFARELAHFRELAEGAGSVETAQDAAKVLKIVEKIYEQA